MCSFYGSSTIIFCNAGELHCEVTLGCIPTSRPAIWLAIFAMLLYASFTLWVIEGFTNDGDFPVPNIQTFPLFIDDRRLAVFSSL